MRDLSQLPAKVAADKHPTCRFCMEMDEMSNAA
jgi:hypothetical protein